MFLVENQRLAYVSGAFATWFDTDATALTGRPVDAVVASHDWDGFEAALARVQEADGLASTTCRCRLVTATEWAPVVIELVALPGRRGVVGSVQADVTLERTRDELATARDRFGHLFDLVQDAVVEFEIVETIPVVRSVNPAFEEVFGYDADAVVGESLNEFIVPPERGGQAVDFDARTAEGKVNHAVVTRETASGPREFLYQGIPYEREGGGRYGFAIYTDITDQRRRERRLQVLHRVLRHNLRNDLTVIEGVVNTLRETVDDPETRARLGLVRDHAQALQRVSEKARTIEDAIERAERTTTVSLAETVEGVLAAAAERHPDATVDRDLDRSVTASANPAVEAAVEELVANAVEHNDGDPTVRVSVVAEGDEALVTVADDGPGIPPEDRAVVFGGEDITQLQHGSGLGLWLVRWVTEAAGGTVIHDRSDGWTSVTLALPRASADVVDTGGNRPDVDTSASTD
jgi:PAS domain S-box-containing protein